MIINAFGYQPHLDNLINLKPVYRIFAAKIINLLHVADKAINSLENSGWPDNQYGNGFGLIFQNGIIIF